MVKPDLRNLHAEATELHKHGEFAKAEKLYREILRYMPALADIHNSRGVALAAMQRFKEALEAFRRANALAPEKVNFRFNLANALKDLGMSIEAKQQYQAILKSDPNFIPAHVQLGLMYKEEKNWHSVIEHFYHVCELKPDMLDASVELGLALLQEGRYEYAVEVFQRAFQLSPTCQIALLGIGDAYLTLNQAARAIEWFQKAIELSAQSSFAKIKKGRALQQLGRHSEAVMLYQDMIQQAPNDLPAYLELANAIKLSDGDIVLVKQVESLIEKENLSTNERVIALFALGKMYDDIGLVDKAFHAFQCGNQIQDELLEAYIPENYHKEITAAISIFNMDFFTDHIGIGCESDQPVFIVGLPRSGTTLTEQILASHPEVIGAGEVPFWHVATVALPIELDTKSPYPECAGLLNKDAATRIAQAYLNKLAQFAGNPEAERIIDKFPQNYLFLGLIATIFPKAKIIHIKRDAMDVCFSLYCQLFEAGHNYAYDLGKIGHQYKEYERIMQHWREVLPIKMLEISYENLVSDQERVTRQMIDYIGLSWNERCLEPEKSENIIRTASIWQARQPVYKTSVARWKKYEKYLGSLKEELGYQK